jgi:hypothetical protein
LLDGVGETTGDEDPVGVLDSALETADEDTGRTPLLVVPTDVTVTDVVSTLEAGVVVLAVEYDSTLEV